MNNQFNLMLEKVLLLIIYQLVCHQFSAFVFNLSLEHVIFINISWCNLSYGFDSLLSNWRCLL